MNNRKTHKRHILLLEVLIAFALVALCIFPLIAPHVFILKAQYQFNTKVALDQSAAKIYTHILEKAYKREIPWRAIEEKQIFTIDDDFLRKAGIKGDFSHKGSYQLSIARSKGKKQPLTANVIRTIITLEPKESSGSSAEGQRSQQIAYEYKFFAAHIQEPQQTEENEDKTTAIHSS